MDNLQKLHCMVSKLEMENHRNNPQGHPSRKTKKDSLSEVLIGARYGNRTRLSTLGRSHSTNELISQCTHIIAYFARNVKSGRQNFSRSEIRCDPSRWIADLPSNGAAALSCFLQSNTPSGEVLDPPFRRGVFHFSAKKNADGRKTSAL